MNQSSMQPQPPAVAKWLWITLIVVGVAGAGFLGWYYLKGPGKAVKTSTSTSTPSTATTTTDTNKSTTTDTTGTTQPSDTTTPSDNSSSTTQTTTAPSGWKVAKGDVATYRDPSASYLGGSYQLFIKNDWVSYQTDIGPAKYMIYGAEGCREDNSPAVQNCLVGVGIGSNKSTYSSQVPGKQYYINLDFNSSLSEQDKKIVLQGFQASAK